MIVNNDGSLSLLFSKTHSLLGQIPIPITLPAADALQLIDELTKLRPTIEGFVVDSHAEEIDEIDGEIEQIQAAQAEGEERLRTLIERRNGLINQSKTGDPELDELVGRFEQLFGVRLI